MSITDALIFVAALVGGLAWFFVMAAVVSDLIWPWAGGLWRVRLARPQARYLPKKP
ncbi:MAG: hypothetical protein KAX64_00560 [Chromatiaceae bacterium]|nr:hypothetical protein [Chromatiaceae bacterium]